MTKISDDGLDIMALLQLTMDRADVEEFLAVYKGVVHEYPAMVDAVSYTHLTLPTILRV